MSLLDARTPGMAEGVKSFRPESGTQTAERDLAYIRLYTNCWTAFRVRLNSTNAIFFESMLSMLSLIATKFGPTSVSVMSFAYRLLTTRTLLFLTTLRF